MEVAINFQIGTGSAGQENETFWQQCYNKLFPARLFPLQINFRPAAFTKMVIKV